MDNMYAIPVSRAPAEERSAFLRQVGLTTFAGLGVATLTSIAMMMAIVNVPLLQERYVALIVMLGAMFASQTIGGGMVNSGDSGTRVGGFVLGTGLQGVAMGYLLLSAILMSSELYADPLLMIGQALGLVSLTVLGMVAYLMSGPKNLSMVGGAISALSLPMIGLMVFTALFPINGPMGMIVSLVFVGISVGGLLYNLNQVMHRMSTDMVLPAAYHIAIGVLVLFWNILSLLMRANRR